MSTENVRPTIPESIVRECEALEARIQQIQKEYDSDELAHPMFYSKKVGLLMEKQKLIFEKIKLLMDFHTNC